MLTVYPWVSLAALGQWGFEAYDKAQSRKGLSRLPKPLELVVRFDLRGNFTTALLSRACRGLNSDPMPGVIIASGVTKRRPSDQPDALVGMTIALTRALEELNELMGEK